MAVKTQSASATAPSAGTSPVAPAAAAPAPAGAALSFEDLVALELGDAADGVAEAETQSNKPAKGTRPAAIAPTPEEDGGGDPDETLDGDDADGAADEPDDDALLDEDGNPVETEAAAGDGEEEEPTDDTAHEDLPPEHFKKLPAWAQKRLGKQSETVKTLRAELATRAFGIAPTPASPLAHVETMEDLQQQTDLAKKVRAWCRANPEGGVIGDMEISAEDAAAKLNHAESVLEAAPDWQSRLNRRAELKPWEGAKRVCPEIFEPGTEQNQFVEMALKMCPEIKTKIPNWEMLLAAAARSIAQDLDEVNGRAKYVRMPMKDGKITAPQKPVGSQKPGTKPAPPAGGSAGPVRPPGTSPAPVARARGGKPDTAALEKRYATSGDAEDLAALVAAEMA